MPRKTLPILIISKAKSKLEKKKKIDKNESEVNLIFKVCTNRGKQMISKASTKSFRV